MSSGAESRPTSNTHSGRPWNDLSRPDYTFTDADRQPRAAWADDFMKLAVSGVLGRDVKNARYTKILQKDRAAGMFWPGAGLSSRPVYPGSVGIALASDLSVEAWFCGESDSADQKRLRAALPAGSVFPRLGEQESTEQLHPTPSYSSIHSISTAAPKTRGAHGTSSSTPRVLR